MALLFSSRAEAHSERVDCLAFASASVRSIGSWFSDSRVDVDCATATTKHSTAAAAARRSLSLKIQRQQSVIRSLLRRPAYPASCCFSPYLVCVYMFLRRAVYILRLIRHDLHTLYTYLRLLKSVQHLRLVNTSLWNSNRSFVFHLEYNISCYLNF